MKGFFGSALGEFIDATRFKLMVKVLCGLYGEEEHEDKQEVWMEEGGRSEVGVTKR